ncbi:hypothetical protein SAMN05192529_10292 [Arachidicoccus rhizosphaerae]|uniref:Bacteriophage CI repressor helix-turn-helix domain-containing protein n=1 Tax=Arachidicoccus rhizosphaerae TaxID=551991 RepID=A0A1H3W358_9BACT|nr:hypothetical protein [Arachidicoccus rhizosphaerae]SDZ81486.1 hypothetical protein SAMN05192529_10292 [Arachidicoccus rhizosphaerae]
MENIKSRILEFIESLPYGQDKFEKKCGLSRGYVNKLGDNMTAKTQAKIQNEFPELNMDWLIKGEGEMLEGKEAIKSMDTKDVVIGFILNEIAEIKSSMKGTFYSDEKEALLSRIAQIDNMKK